MYRDPAADPYKITPKGYAQTRDTKTLANPMIMLNVTSIMRDADPSNTRLYDDIITGLIADIQCFYSLTANTANGSAIFAEMESLRSPSARDIPTKVRSIFCGCWQSASNCLKHKHKHPEPVGFGCFLSNMDHGSANQKNYTKWNDFSFLHFGTTVEIHVL